MPTDSPDPKPTLERPFPNTCSDAPVVGGQMHQSLAANWELASRGGGSYCAQLSASLLVLSLCLRDIRGSAGSRGCVCLGTCGLRRARSCGSILGFRQLARFGPAPTRCFGSPARKISKSRRASGRAVVDGGLAQTPPRSKASEPDGACGLRAQVPEQVQLLAQERPPR